jgi:hypothetical protein
LLVGVVFTFLEGAAGDGVAAMEKGEVTQAVAKSNAAMGAARKWKCGMMNSVRVVTIRS